MIDSDLAQLKSYYDFTRGVGHTDLLRRGLDNCDRAFVMANNYRTGQHIARSRQGITPVSLSSLDKLRGANAPLAWDNSAIYDLIYGSLSEIDRLRKTISRQEGELEELRG